MLMIPGTLNSECIADGKEQEVEIAQVWDGNRPKVDLLLADFQAYLTDIRKCQGKKDEVRAEKTTLCYHFQ